MYSMNRWLDVRSVSVEQEGVGGMTGIIGEWLGMQKCDMALMGVSYASDQSVNQFRRGEGDGSIMTQ